MPATAPETETLPGAEATTLDLTGVTAYTAGILRLAEAKGLRPSWAAPHGNTRRVVLNAPGPHGTFGSITTGRTSGKVLRAQIVRGNGATPLNPKGTNAVRELLTRIPAAHCSEHCVRPADSCRP
ncbi:hypothetical protein [Streptomyces sp. BH055]|uniref:hypothetical protein n=1 Tax=unclassified Streptomyces TaxID=2593676 RepID=UPI003BB67294